MLGTFFKLVGKAIRFSINRPIQRFNIYNRAKKYLGQEAKYFSPAPRAIGSLSLKGPSKYPHLEGSSFKSIKQRRLEALAKRNQLLLEKSTTNNEPVNGHGVVSIGKSFSETRQDDLLVIETLNKLAITNSVLKLDTNKDRQQTQEDTPQSANSVDEVAENPKKARSLPKLTSLPRQDITSIWVVEKTPPGRLDLNMLQELMINKLADDKYWTPARIAERYKIKEEYAQMLIQYIKQIRIVISPRIAKVLDYVSLNNPVYQSTKHIIYHVDKSLRSKNDRQYDGMYLPTDQLDDEIRELIDAGAVTEAREEAIRRHLMKRPQPLRILPANRPKLDETTSRISGDNGRSSQQTGRALKAHDETIPRHIEGRAQARDKNGSVT